MILEMTAKLSDNAKREIKLVSKNGYHVAMLHIGIFNKNALFQALEAGKEAVLHVKFELEE